MKQLKIKKQKPLDYWRCACAWRLYTMQE